MIFREPTYKAPQAPSVEQMNAIYGNRALEKGVSRRVLDDPIAGQEGSLTPGKEYLNNILFVGDTALGIVQAHDAQMKVSQVRLVVLPVGSKSGVLGERQSSGTLARIDTGSLREPRMGGSIQPSETVEVGRRELATLTGVVDEHVSGKHLSLTVTAEGAVYVTDTSTNGTRMITALDLMRSEEAGGLVTDAKGQVAQFVRQFEDSPYMWEESASGQRVINPYQ